MKIPIKNIYYLLVYAWDVLPEGEIVKTGVEERTELFDLFGQVLDNGLAHLLRQGVDRNYVAHQESIPGIRGRILFGPSLNHMLFPQGRAFCEFDDFSHNVLPNQILKATIRKLMKVRELKKDLRDSLTGKLRFFQSIDDIVLCGRTFRSVQLHRNNRFYGFLLDICRLIHDNLLLNEETGEAFFRDFIRDEDKMAALFQKFVFNFYKREQEQYKVKADTLSWTLMSGSSADLQYIPGMHTDITLSATKRTIIIDTKYYAKTLTQTPHSDKEIIHPGNLYQMFSYMMNAVAAGKPKVEGVLLYPDVSKSIELNYSINRCPLKIVTINLGAHWQAIRRQLLTIVGIPNSAQGQPASKLSQNN